MPRHPLVAVRNHTGPLQKMPMAQYSTRKHVYALGGAIMQAANVDEPAALHLSRFLLQQADPEHPVQESLEALRDVFGPPEDLPEIIPVEELAGGAMFGDFLNKARAVLGRVGATMRETGATALRHARENAPAAKEFLLDQYRQRRQREQELADEAANEAAAKRAAEAAARVEVHAAVAAQRAVDAARAEAEAARDAARAAAGLDPEAHREAAHEAIEANAVAREAAKAARTELAAAQRARTAATHFEKGARASERRGAAEGGGLFDDFIKPAAHQLDEVLGPLAHRLVADASAGGAAAPRSLPELIRAGRATKKAAAARARRGDAQQREGAGILSGLLGAFGLGSPRAAAKAAAAARAGGLHSFRGQIPFQGGALARARLGGEADYSLADGTVFDGLRLAE